MLISCNNATAPSTGSIASIQVAGPAGNALKIGETVQFGATAKDDKGNTLTGKTFTWASSDNSVASVDTNGKVTANRFGKVKISASTEGKSGDSPAQTTWGLEAVGGTRTDWNGTRPGTAFLARFRKADGSGPAGMVDFSLKGPAGWNGDQPLAVAGIAGYDGFVYPTTRGNIAAVSGSYTLSASAEGQEYSYTFSIDASKTLAAPASIAASAASSSGVTSTWSAVEGVPVYSSSIWNDTEQTSVVSAWETSNAHTFSDLNLDPLKTYYLQASSYSFDPRGGTGSVAFSQPLPESFNTGFVRAPFAVPVVSGAKLTLTLSAGQWTAFQDGNGPWVWQGSPDTNFTKELPITDANGRYGLAFGTWVAYLTAAEVPTIDTTQFGRCSDAGLTRSATLKPTFTLTNATDKGSFSLLRSDSSNRVLSYSRNNQSAGASADLSLAPGTYTLLAHQRALDSQGNSINRSPAILQQRTLNVVAGNNPLALNFTTGSFTAATNGTANITGVVSSSFPYLNTRLVPAAWRYRCNPTFSLAIDQSTSANTSGSYAANRYMLPTAFFVAGDRLRYDAGTVLTSGTRTDYVERIVHILPSTTQPAAFALGGFLASGDAGATANLPEARNLPTAFPTATGFYSNTFSQTIAGATTTLQLDVSKSWLAGLGATATVKFPDLSSLPFYSSGWKLKSGEVSYTLLRLETANNADMLAFFRNSLPDAWSNTGRSNKFTNP